MRLCRKGDGGGERTESAPARQAEGLRRRVVAALMWALLLRCGGGRVCAASASYTTPGGGIAAVYPVGSAVDPGPLVVTRADGNCQRVERRTLEMRASGW